MNPWLEHVKNYRRKHPTLSYKEVLINAKQTYRKRLKQGGENGNIALPKFGISKPERNIISKYKEYILTSITVCRKPIVPVIKNVLRLFSGFKLNKKLKQMDYDDLFHLYAVIGLSNGENQTFLKIEKNELLKFRIVSSPTADSTTQCIDVPVNRRLTFGQIIMKGVRKDGMNFFHYSGKVYNCQRFIDTILRPYLRQVHRRFILQNTREVFKVFPKWTEKVANLTTDLAGKLRNITGQGNNKKTKRTV